MWVCWARGYGRSAPGRVQGWRYWWNFMLISYLFIFYGSIMCYHFHSIDLMWFARLCAASRRAVCAHFSRRSLYFAYVCDFFLYFFFSFPFPSPSTIHHHRRRRCRSMSTEWNIIFHTRYVTSTCVCEIVNRVHYIMLSCESIICSLSVSGLLAANNNNNNRPQRQRRRNKKWKSTRVHSRWHG